MMTAAVMFFVFELFDNIQTQHMCLIRKASPLDLAPIDYQLWLEGPLALITTIFGLVARIAGIAFLIYLGFQTRWFYPIILYAVSLPITIIFQSIIHIKIGLRLPAQLGYIVMPIVGVWMWFTV